MSARSRRRHLSRVGRAAARPAAVPAQEISPAVRRALLGVIMAPQWEPVEKLVFLYFALTMNEHRASEWVRFPIEEVAEGLGVCEDCINDAVDALASAGAFVVRDGPPAPLDGVT